MSKKKATKRQLYLGVHMPAEMLAALKARAAKGLHSVSAEVRLAVQGHLAKSEG